MTKSGIGTQQQHINMVNNTNINNSNNGSETPVQQQQQTISSSALIANAEIPIWVADKKKWVTGISKKTTINDLIFAILKQCQITVLSKDQETSLSSAYVLVEYNFEANQEAEHQVVLASQRILNGDSKVYKYLAKWSFNGQQPQQNSNLMLKILMRQAYETNVNSEQNGNQHNIDAHSSPSSSSLNNTDFGNNKDNNKKGLATKLLKKFGVSSSHSSGSVGQTNQHQNGNINPKNTNNSSPTNTPANQTCYRYVDVKLPTVPTQTTTPAPTSQPKSSSFNLSPISTNSTNSLNNSNNANNLNSNRSLKNFDPHGQKSFITNSIMEKDNKLKQQIKRFQLIDELIKETEKKSKSELFDGKTSPTAPSSFLTNPIYNYSPGGNTTANGNAGPGFDIKAHISDSKTQSPLNVVDLNDVYCHFPEMSTHHLKEVEDFTFMCSQLFQLEEAIKNQKSILNTLESDLQRELQPSQSQFLIENGTTGLAENQCDSSQGNIKETPETEELRKEVNYSREQTRIQCKQLHDIDMRMKQNEQSLMMKEQELQQLLEELYIQEIYADNALETAIVNTTPNRPTTPSGNLLNMSTFKMHSPNTINNLLNSSQNKQASGVNNVVHLHHADVHNESSGMLNQNETMDSFENGNNNESNVTHDRERMVELIINERNSFNNSNIDFMQQQQKQLTMENALDQQTKRQIRMYNENDNQHTILMNNNTQQMDSISILKQQQQTANSIKTQQQPQKVVNNISYTTGKSLSFGNLTNQQINGHTNSTHNLNHITSPSQHTIKPKLQQHYGNNGNQHDVSTNDINTHNHSAAQNHSMSMSMKNLKINQSNQFISHHGPNGDHSGGDNDSGISSMSSETAAALNNANIIPNSFGYLQKQHQPIIMGQMNQRFNNNNGHLNQQQWQQQQQFIQNQGQRQPIYHGGNQHHGSNLNINQSPVNTSVANTSVSKAVLETLV